MRIRTILAALFVVASITTPATAGNGVSQYCGDGYSYVELPIHGLPITVGAELLYPPTNNHQVVNICFSPTPEGAPGAIAGGWVGLDIWTDTGTVSPGAYVALYCAPDGGIWCSGTSPNSANVGVTDVRVETPNSTLCIVSVGTGCALPLPGVRAYLNGNQSVPLLSIQVAGVPVTVDSPVACLAVIVVC